MSTRKVHGKRIKSPSNEDTYVDIIRIDGLVDMENAGGQRQTLKLDWRDDGDNNNPGRTMEDVRVPAMSSDFVIPAIRKLRTNNSGQRAIHTFKNRVENGVRDMVVKRVYSTDLEIPDGGAVDWDTFLDDYAAATKSDNAAFLDVAITASYGRKQQQGAVYQGGVFHLRNKPLLDLMEDAPGGPDVVLDPFQIIVNLSGGDPPPGTPNGLYFAYVLSAVVTTPPVGEILATQWFESGGERIGYYPSGQFHVTTAGDGVTITIVNPTRVTPVSGPDEFSSYWVAGTYSADQVFVNPLIFPETGEVYGVAYGVYIPVPKTGA